ncbi:hypothetical protein [Mycoplasma capricolum]|uniref:hypothetical protein n=1 Tax=Mycoplasma capricolum TaxID=2095 RepID=UPI001FB62271|nr:hypothetical protein [Mycoplasma capricolum]
MKKLIALLTAISVSTAGGFSYIGYKNLSNGTTIDNQENEFKQLEKELKKFNLKLKIEKIELNF